MILVAREGSRSGDVTSVTSRPRTATKYAGRPPTKTPDAMVAGTSVAPDTRDGSKSTVIEDNAPTTSLKVASIT